MDCRNESPLFTALPMTKYKLIDHTANIGCEIFLMFILRINTIALLFFQDEPPGAEPFIGMGIGRTPYTLGTDPGINGPGETAVFNQTG